MQHIKGNKIRWPRCTYPYPQEYCMVVTEQQVNKE